MLCKSVDSNEEVKKTIKEIDEEKNKMAEIEDKNMARRHRVSFYVGKGKRRRKRSFLAR